MYLSEYTSKIIKLVENFDEQQLQDAFRLIRNAESQNGKLIVAGNGGSAAMASHVSVDFLKAAHIRCMNFNEADLITCFANDFGFDRWIEKAVNFYGGEGDVLIAISSSGSSENVVNGVKAAREGNFSAVVTLSGFHKDNVLRSLGDVNLWVDSKAYNFVENIHQIWLLAIVDLVIGKREYSA